LEPRLDISAAYSVNIFENLLTITYSSFIHIKHLYSGPSRETTQRRSIITSKKKDYNYSLKVKAV